jgi:hypothetical protein
MMYADEEHSARAAELVPRPGLPRGPGNGDHRGPELGGEPAGGSGILVGRRTSRRDRFEVVCLLLGILGVLVVVVMTVGAAPPA